MLLADPANSLQHYPMDMSRFGRNPFGENRFRIILAASRRSLVQGQWNEAGLPRARWCQTYPQFAAGELYILEEWVDAFTFTGTTPTGWTMGDGQYLGPYPHRGEYVMCGNSGFDPMQTNIEKLISLVHAADKYSWSEKLVACKNMATKEEIEKKCLRESIIRDCFPAFDGATFSQLSTGAGGASKSTPVLRSANELGLPVPQGTPGQATTGGATIRKTKRRRAA